MHSGPDRRLTCNLVHCVTHCGNRSGQRIPGEGKRLSFRSSKRNAIWPVTRELPGHLGELSMNAKHVLALSMVAVLMLQNLMFMSPSAVVPTLTESGPMLLTENMYAPANPSEGNSLVMNVIQNAGFEEADSQNGPEYWSYYGSEDITGDKVYSEDAANGTNAGYVRARSTPRSAQAWLARDLALPWPYLSQGIALGFFWNVLSNTGSPQNGRAYLIMQLYNGSQYYNLFYYFSFMDSWNPGNSSGNGNYMIPDELEAWHSFSRNITGDFDSIPQAPPITPTWRISALSFNAYAPQGAWKTELLVDTFVLRNSTSYVYGVNGDFESEGGEGWSTSNYDGTIIQLSELHTEGSKSVNLSCPTGRESVSCYAGLYIYLPYPQGYYATAQKELMVSFDYMYSDTFNHGGSWAFLYVRLSNQSNNWYAYWFLGQDNDQNLWGNGTDQRSFNATGFGQRNTWHHVEIDLYQVEQEWGMSNVSAAEFGFWVQRGWQSGASVQLLLDDFAIVTYPTGDPGFEQDWYTDYSNPITGWQTSSGYSGPISYSSDAHSGDNSLQLHSDTGYSMSVVRWTSVPVTRGLYTDFWWKLDSAPSPGSYSSIRMRFEPQSYVQYVIADTSTGSYNDSTTACYYVDNWGENGTWFGISRNVYDDLAAVVGEGSYRLYAVDLMTSAWSGGQITVLMDDINFALDVEAPQISSVILVPSEPVYHEDVEVRMSVSDNRAVDQVKVHYMIGSSSWTEVEAGFSDGHYVATIPMASYGTTVQYCVTATDLQGNNAIYDNSGFNYTYVVDDDVPPILAVYRPFNSSTVEGNLIVIVEATDPDTGSSGLQAVRLWNGNSIISVDDEEPYVFQVNTRLAFANGTQTLSAEAVDVAGNSAFSNITLFLSNDFSGPAISSVELSPVGPQYDEDASVIVAVTDSSVITDVQLQYRLDAGSWQLIHMSHSGSMYTATIPAAPWGTVVSYLVVAEDSFGQTSQVGSATTPLSYTVDDRVAPVLAVSGPPTTQVLKGLVKFTVAGSDTGSGIHSIRLQAGAQVDISQLMLVSPWTIECDTSAWLNGVYTFRFTLQDRALNTAVIEMSYEVYNPQGIEWLTSSFQDMMSQYGFIVGAGTVLALIVIAKLLLRRRSR